MLGADGDGRIFFLHNDLLLYIPKANGTEKPKIC